MVITGQHWKKFLIMASLTVPQTTTTAAVATESSSAVRGILTSAVSSLVDDEDDENDDDGMAALVEEVGAGKWHAYVYDGASSSSIGDGGSDMYDDGNKVSRGGKMCFGVFGGTDRSNPNDLKRV